MQKNIFYNYRILLLVIPFILYSCTPKLQVTRNVPIAELSVCMEFADGVSENIAQKFDSTLINFISNYNQKKHRFKLTECINSDSMALRLMIGKSNLITPGQQTVATVITAVGLITPFVMIANGSNFYLYFYYLPYNKTPILAQLSQDLNSSTKNSRKREATSFSLYGSLETQLYRQIDSFDGFLKGIIKEVEVSYKKQEKPRGPRKRRLHK